MRKVFSTAILAAALTSTGVSAGANKVAQHGWYGVYQTDPNTCITMNSSENNGVYSLGYYQSADKPHLNGIMFFVDEKDLGYNGRSIAAIVAAYDYQMEVKNYEYDRRTIRVNPGTFLFMMPRDKAEAIFSHAHVIVELFTNVDKPGRKFSFHAAGATGAMRHCEKLIK